MPRRTRAQSGLVVLLALALLPLAAAQASLPAVPDVTTEGLPGTGTVLDIQQGPLTFRGPAHSPTYVLVSENGTRALEYEVDAEGRARLHVAGQPTLEDATLVRVEGDPSGSAFRLVLRDAQDGLHVVAVDKAALAAAPDATPPEAPVQVTRPPTWPGAPQKGYLLHVRDGAANQLASHQLDGERFLQRDGTHRATLQMPLAENEWDRWLVSARRQGENATLNASFATSHRTNDTIVLAATFAPALLGLGNGDRVSLEVVHEKRLSPLVVQRFVEPRAYSYKVDGVGPTISLNAPAQSSDFRFTVTWSGRDDLSGVGSFVIYSRASGTSAWSHWLTTFENGGIFSGDWGKTYELRALSLDRVGNPSQEVFATTRVIAQPAGQDDVNDPPEARLLTPVAGSELSGVVAVTWLAEDVDGTPVTSRVELSEDDGATWRLLYVGRDKSTSWDTRDDADGSRYRIRLTVSDGAHSVADTASALRVRNVVAPPAPPAPDPLASPSPGAPPASDAPPGERPGAPVDEGPAAAAVEDDAKRVPAAFAGVAIVAAALLARRRTR